MLKLKVEKIEDVEEAQRGFYTEDKEGGGFVLGVEGLEDTGALKRAKEHEVEQRKATEKKLKEMQDAQRLADEKARKAAEDAARAAGNIQALEDSWTKKYSEALAAKDTEYQPQIESLTADVNRLLIDNVAHSMANDLAIEGSSAVLIPHIAARLGVDMREGRRTTVVKGADGKPSALTIDELKKEIASNKAFAPLLVGSRASGGGAGGAKGGGAAGAKNLKRADFEKLDAGSRQKHFKEGGTVTDQ